MYTWGSSPQALRLANQIKRRANAKQKIEEHQRREMSRRFEATISTAPIAATETQNSSTDSPAKVPTLTITTPSLDVIKADDEDVVTSIAKDEIVSGVAAIVPENVTLPLDETVIVSDEANIQIIDDGAVGEVPILKTNPIAATVVVDNVESKCASSVTTTTSNTNVPNNVPTTSTQQAAATADVDPCEHMSPHLVDTSEVAGQILQVFYF